MIPNTKPMASFGVIQEKVLSVTTTIEVPTKTHWLA